MNFNFFSRTVSYLKKFWNIFPMEKYESDFTLGRRDKVNTKNNVVITINVLLILKVPQKIFF
jgi:hypothetical protein